MVHQSPRILIVSLGGTFGGVEHYLTGLAGFLEDGAELHVLTQQPELRRRLKAMGVHVLPMPELPKPLRFPVTALLLPLIFLYYGIDTLQLNGYLDTIFAPWARLLGRRVICTRHGTFDVEAYRWYRQPHKFYPRWLCRVCSRFASRVVCVSETVKQDVAPYLPARIITVIRNWVAQIPRMHLPEQDGRTLRLLYVGRLERYKGVHLILEAMKRLHDVELTVVGGGPAQAELEQLAAGMPVQFVGFQAVPAPFFRAADLLVMPSLGPEGLPLSPLEAMAYSLPVLLSDLPVHAEISAGGSAGALFRSGDAGDLGEKIEQLRDLSTRQARARLAHALVEEEFGAEKARQAYRQLFGVKGTA
ncbi:glycosyltransferase family 4 protein [Acidipila sp. EB88]|uniref:glycosyltransferase family 4 protein n=1 Tax=Acidipila sp. EB88 TaxID=2305226 RepID=UPI000F5D82A3|nr:glycosyltransferase family 4 protein [Acidipila sp. EB88]RRA48242.1 glycosyltransferase family 1 protein [Acidipila sp. EB88]